LTRAELKAALDEAERNNGLHGDILPIAVSASPEDLPRLEAIRVKTMDVVSDLGNKRFRAWSDAIKMVRRGSW
jgi:hypothetical protein